MSTIAAGMTDAMSQRILGAATALTSAMSAPSTNATATIDSPVIVTCASV